LYKDGYTTVLEPSECLNVSESGKRIAGMLQRACRDSEMDIYDRVAKTGFWRSALVRTYSTGQNMVLVQVNPVGVDAAVIEKELENIKAKLIEESQNDGLHLTSLYFQQYDGSFNGIVDTVDPVLSHGSPTVMEVLLGVKYFQLTQVPHLPLLVLPG
jgi:tRNA (uracil-5-)-methyltransferase